MCLFKITQINNNRRQDSDLGLLLAFVLVCWLVLELSLAIPLPLPFPPPPPPPSGWPLLQSSKMAAIKLPDHSLMPYNLFALPLILGWP